MRPRQRDEFAAERRGRQRGRRSRRIAAARSRSLSIAASRTSPSTSRTTMPKSATGRDRRKRDADAAEPGGAVQQVLDQVGDAEARSRAARGRPPQLQNSVAQGSRPARGAASPLHQVAATGPPRRPRPAAAVAPAGPETAPLGGSAAGDHDDGRVIEPEGGGLAGAGVHSSRSPIRNCSARSSRIWGSAGAPSGHAAAAAGETARNGNRSPRRRLPRGRGSRRDRAQTARPDRPADRPETPRPRSIAVEGPAAGLLARPRARRECRAAFRRRGALRPRGWRAPPRAR